jgi:8-oxo-dGTP diphosphatase
VVDGDGTLAFQRSLPAKRMAAGLLLRDRQGRILLVEPTYKADWEIPGGAVDRGESPRGCVAREVREELGLEIAPGRLLVVEHQHAAPDRTESVMFVFDGGVARDDLLDRVRLPASELRSCRFVPASELDAFTSPRLGRRLSAALRVLAAAPDATGVGAPSRAEGAGARAVSEPTAIYLEDGSEPGR